MSPEVRATREPQGLEALDLRLEELRERSRIEHERFDELTKAIREHLAAAEVHIKRMRAIRI